MSDKWKGKQYISEGPVWGAGEKVKLIEVPTEDRGYRLLSCRPIPEINDDLLHECVARYYEQVHQGPDGLEMHIVLFRQLKAASKYHPGYTQEQVYSWSGYPIKIDLDLPETELRFISDRDRISMPVYITP